MRSPGPGRALILPGAIAKGAFEAGVLGVLAHRDVEINRIVAASSGSLNAIVYAAGARAGRPREAVDELISAWVEHGSWYDSLHFTLRGWLTGRGLSDSRGLLKLLGQLVKPCTTKLRRPIDLRIVVAPLRGMIGKIGSKPATTYEGVLHFSGEDFDSEKGLRRIFDAAAAACAFPGLFAPVELPGLGPCVDGGAVNNTPIRYALADSDIDRIIVPIPMPRVFTSSPSSHGVAMFVQVFEALLNERLYRDLKYSELKNTHVAELEALFLDAGLSPKLLHEMRRILDWRKVEITEVRPAESLRGTLFSGFLDRGLRAHYVEEGRKSAENILQSA